jgi:hypothetical protein
VPLGGIVTEMPTNQRPVGAGNTPEKFDPYFKAELAKSARIGMVAGISVQDRAAIKNLSPATK